MGRISIQEAEKYKSSGNTEWFSLKDNGDTATVRFLYRDIDDVNIDVVHKVQVNNKDRYVNCIRSYDENSDACPLCRAGFKTELKLFVPVLNLNTNTVQVWQRGRTFSGSLSGLMNRYSPLFKYGIDIERQGAKGDQTTKYQLYPNPKVSNDVEWDDMPDVPVILGGIVMDKNFAELDEYVKTGHFAEDKPTITARETSDTKRTFEPRRF